MRSGLFWKCESHAEPRGTCHGVLLPPIHPAAGAAGLSGEGNVVKPTHYQQMKLLDSAARNPYSAVSMLSVQTTRFSGYYGYFSRRGWRAL